MKLFIKICATFFAFLLARSVCAQTGDSLVIENYENGNIKQKISLNQKGIKNGESFYYAEEGSLDSSVSFKNGMLNGVKKIFYAENSIFYFDYKSNRVISFKIYDSLNKLQYETPLSLNPIPKTIWKFTSGRNYYDQSKSDTLTVNRDVPVMNQHIYFPGATVKPIDKYSWEIKAWKPQPNSNNGKMVVDIYQNVVDDIQIGHKKHLRKEIIFIPIK